MIQWTDSLRTGYAEIDADHQEIILRINSVEQAIRAGAPKAELLKTIEFLDTYTQVHFAREESLMNRIHCPVHQANCSAHKTLIDKLSRWRQSIEAGYSIPLLLEVYGDLSEWIVSHIMKVDCQLRGSK